MLRHGGSQTEVRGGNRIISRATRNAPLKQPQLLYWFAAFFAFGAMMCLLTIVLLVFPGTKLDSLWNLNPDARVAFQSLGSWSVLLMLTVGTGCALAAIGLWRGARSGARAGLAILLVNVIGDLVNVITRHDLRSLVGVPIAGAMIFYLVRSTTRHTTH
jgi:formate hydrogenlyase subunit 4